MMWAGVAAAQPGSPPPPPPPPPGGGGYYAAQPPTYYPGPPERSGFLIGFSLGGGEMIATDCEGCDSLAGLGFDFSIGGFINPRLAIMYDAFAVLHPEDDVVLTNGTNTAAVQYWVTPQLWIKGGIGFSQIRLSDGGGEIAAEYGVGATAGVGFEVISSRTFALDIAGRVSHGTFDGGGVSNGAVLVGVHWY
jgi:hypothetical protein